MVSETGREKFELNPKRLVLEIGVGSAPHFLHPELQETELGTDFYIGLDKEKQAARWNKEQIKEYYIDGQTVVSDAQNLPFTDASVDEVILNNILNSPIILKGQRGGAVNMNRVKNTHRRQKEWLEAGKKIFLEAQRVLKTDGKILILEYDLGDNESAENREIYDDILELVYNSAPENFQPVIKKRSIVPEDKSLDQLKALEIHYIEKPPK